MIHNDFTSDLPGPTITYGVEKEEQKTKKSIWVREGRQSTKVFASVVSVLETEW